MTDNTLCISCGGDLGHWLSMPIDPMKNTKTPFASALRCDDCGLGVISPLPEPCEIPELYALDQYYTHGASHIARLAPSFLDKALIKLAWWFDRSELFAPSNIIGHLPPPEHAKICDLGCGGAKYLQEFQAAGFSVLGVDPDANAREQAMASGVSVLPGTAEDLPPDMATDQYDLVIMTHSLEHCRNPLTALENAFRLTAPGGLCYVEVPNCACEHFETFTVCSTMFDAPRHLQFFTPSSLKAMMEKVGFSWKKTLHMGYVRQFHPSWRAWEATIHDRAIAADPSLRLKRHNFLAGAALFLRSAFMPRERKYDSIGYLMRRPYWAVDS